MYHRRIAKQQGSPQDYGLPEPDHKLGEAHPTISSEILTRIGHGRVTPKPNIERLEGARVRFADGSVEDVDVIIYCTGYRISFPFLVARGASIRRTTSCRSTGASCTPTAPASGSSG